MSSLNKLVQRSLRQLTTPTMMTSQRVVSTSPRHDQGVTSLHLESAAMGQCPFRKTMDNLTETLTVEKRSDISDVQSFESIPGPKGLPVVGTLFDYFKKDGPKFSKMFEVYRQRALEYGQIYFEKVGAFSSVIISSPEEYNKLIHSEGKYPIRREMMPTVHYRKTKGLDLGLVNSQGEEWYKQRTVVSKKMLKLSEVSSFSQQMGQVADDFMTRLMSVRNPQGEVINLEKELFKWAMESIGTFIFEERIGCLGSAPSSLAQSFIDNLEGFFKTLQPLMYNLPLYQIWPTKTWRQFENHSDNLMEVGGHLVEKKVRSLQSGSESKSAFLDHLLHSGTMRPQEVTGLVVDLLTAAVETTSTATVWSLYNLAKHPQVQEKLYQDIQDERAKNNGEPLSAEQLSKLPYVKAVVKETLRLYPITYATSRHLGDDLTLAGYNVPAGTHVQANLYGMFRDPELFHRPEEFRPERWLKENSMRMAPTVKAMSNLVWGHGARMCIGRRVAEQEIHITLSKIIEKFSLQYNHDDVQPILHTMMTPDRLVRIQFTPRQ